MQAGASFVTSARDVCALGDDGARTVVWVGSVGQTLDHQALEVRDHACRGDRFFALYETLDDTVLLELTRDETDLQATMIRQCPRAAHRVAVTAERWYVASDGEIHAIADRTAPFELLAVDAIDMAASPSELCVLDERGVTWFASNGEVIARRLIASPTAVMFDELARGWLVVADGDVLQFADPNAAPLVFARGVGLATRVRREVDALFVVVGGELLEVPGIRDGATTAAPRVVGSYAPDWSDFDAHFHLYVDEGAGPRRFYAPVPCKCRTRTYEVIDSHRGPRREGTNDHVEVRRCPVCGAEWDEWIAGY